MRYALHVLDAPGFDEGRERGEENKEERGDKRIEGESSGTKKPPFFVLQGKVRLLSLGREEAHL